MGCATKPAPIERIQYIFVDVPTELTKRVKLSAPPDVEAYTKMTWDQKEETLIGVIQSRTKEVGVCNARLEGVDKWSFEQAKIYNTTTEK